MELDRSKFDKMREDAFKTRQMVEHWADCQVKYMQESQRQHARALDDDKENLLKLRTRARELDERNLAFSAVASRQESEVASIKSEIDKLRTDEARNAERQRMLSDRCRELRQEIEAERAGKDTRKLKETAATMREGIKFYEERLGLRFARTGQDTLQFIFTHIDPDDWQREFSLSVFVDSEGRYHMSNVNPAVAGLEPFVEELNRTNSLATFMKSIRKKFRLAV